MSANIYWRPDTQARNNFDVGAPSDFIDSIREAFGELPVKLNSKDVPTLKGMASVKSLWRNDNPYKEIIETIEKVGEIEIWAEW
ncbi:MAG: hypothetical protein PHU86_03770 [Patescibacteria group bacterium]|nr:hypothetical protein [Patescibacteria group bacterium]